MVNIYYRDPDKQAKLEAAINLGFISRQLGADSVYTYALTPSGQNQWMVEKIFKNNNP